MPKNNNSQKHPGRGGNNTSLAPMSMNEAVDAMFAIKPADVKKVLESKPERNKKK